MTEHERIMRVLDQQGIEQLAEENKRLRESVKKLLCAEADLAARIAALSHALNEMMAKLAEADGGTGRYVDDEFCDKMHELVGTPQGCN